MVMELLTRVEALERALRGGHGPDSSTPGSDSYPAGGSSEGSEGKPSGGEEITSPPNRGFRAQLEELDLALEAIEQATSALHESHTEPPDQGEADGREPG